MIFQALAESAQRGELLLVDGGLCRWHLRRNGQLTIREILVTRPGQGIGSTLLAHLQRVPGAERIVARCPAALPANGWYARRGFRLLCVEQTRSGAALNVWELPL